MVLRDLYAYLDGRLSPLRTAEVEAHLADCLSCMGEADARRTTRHRRGGD